MTTLLDVNLVGSRLRVRRARLVDASLSYRWFANPDVTRYLPLAGRGGIPIAEIEAYLAFAALHDRPELAVGIDLLGGRTIGCGGFRNFSDGSAELSLILGEPDTWGRGLGFEAMQLLIQLGFGLLGLRVIWLIVRADNERAVRLFERSGFRTVQRLPSAVTIDGIPLDKLRMLISNDIHADVR